MAGDTDGKRDMDKKQMAVQDIKPNLEETLELWRHGYLDDAIDDGGEWKRLGEKDKPSYRAMMPYEKWKYIGIGAVITILVKLFVIGIVKIYK